LKKPERRSELLNPVSVSEREKSKPDARSWFSQFEVVEIPHKMNWSKELRRNSGALSFPSGLTK
jgi:hypothetical protein